MSDELLKIKIHFRCFWVAKNELSWQYVNFIQLMGPIALSCHVMPTLHPTALSLILSFLCFEFSFFLFSLTTPPPWIPLKISSFFIFFFYTKPPLLLHKLLDTATTIHNWTTQTPNLKLEPESCSRSIAIQTTWNLRWLQRRKRGIHRHLR